MTKDNPTEHELAITLYSKPIPGEMASEYWATCSQHKWITNKTRDNAERGYAVRAHLRLNP